MKKRERGVCICVKSGEKRDEKKKEHKGEKHVFQKIYACVRGWGE